MPRRNIDVFNQLWWSSFRVNLSWSFDSRRVSVLYEEEDNKENIKSMPKGPKSKGHSDGHLVEKVYLFKKNDSFKVKSPQVNNGLKVANSTINYSKMLKVPDDAIVPPLKLIRKAGPLNPLATPLQGCYCECKICDLQQGDIRSSCVIFLLVVIRQYWTVLYDQDADRVRGDVRNHLLPRRGHWSVYLKWQNFIQEFKATSCTGSWSAFSWQWLTPDVEAQWVY